MTRRHVPAALALLTATLLATTGTLDTVHALTLPAGALVMWHAWHALGTGTESGWAPAPSEQRHGARHDVTDLGWAALTRDGRVSARVTRRVTAIAAHRLAPHGIDLADPTHRDAAAALLGPDVIDQIRSRRPPTPRTLHRWLDALERIPPTPTRPGRHPR
ncbi:hypothetical protein GCM10009718_23620 [Isoptericola halotolerans]|uniref:Uncharacterized protein n=1 Tax=Isoptericola halotolerans TaxID=300560 RepID=A0ABX2A842_9MICO|nr:hypothetical protein [Isoptericola halotolerans]NOV98075.1 hypothetical protein [Isoptericola halotolerans]